MADGAAAPRSPARPERRDRTRGGGWTGTEFEVTVGPVAHGGHCVARHEGRVVFVRHTLPGERVVVRVTEDRHPGFCRADAIEVLEASPDRVERPCPYSGPGRCGGCDWQHVDPAAQRTLKATVVREQLARLAGLPDVDVPVEELPGGPLRWRSRARFAVDRSGARACAGTGRTTSSCSTTARSRWSRRRRRCSGGAGQVRAPSTSRWTPRVR